MLNNIYTDADLEQYTTPTPASTMPNDYESTKNLLGAQASTLLPKSMDLTRRGIASSLPEAETLPASKTIPDTLPQFEGSVSDREAAVGELVKKGHTFTNKDLNYFYGRAGETLPEMNIPTSPVSTFTPEKTLPSQAPSYEMSPTAKAVMDKMNELIKEGTSDLSGVFASTRRQGRGKIKLAQKMGDVFASIIQSESGAYGHQARATTERAALGLEASKIAGEHGFKGAELGMKARELAGKLGILPAELDRLISETAYKKALTRTLPETYEQEQAGKERIEALKHPPKDLTANVLNAAIRMQANFIDPITKDVNQEAFDRALPGLISSLRKQGLLSDLSQRRPVQKGFDSTTQVNPTPAFPNLLPQEKRVVKRGRDRMGRRVVLFSDGTLEYER